MKKTITLLILGVFIITIASCNASGNHNDMTIPIISDTSGTTTTVISPPTVDDEKEYHRNLGMTIIDSYDEDLTKYYGDLKSYDGRYEILVDQIYRSKLDIEILKKTGIELPIYDKYYELICSFLLENTPKCLLPQYWSSGKPDRLNLQFVNEIYYLASLDEIRVVSNIKLIDLFACYCFSSALSGSNISTDLNNYPIILKELTGDPVSIEGQSFNQLTCRTEISVPRENNETLYVALGKFDVKITNNRLYVFSPDEKVSLPADYSGFISVAKANEYGIIGKTEYYEVESSVSLIPATPVSFKSNRLEKAIREYLNFSENDIITLKDLTEVTSIFITGDFVAVNPSGLSLDILNANEPAKNNDFSFDDLDNFPCLKSLTVKHNKTGNPSGERIKYINYIELWNNGITDISGLEGANASSISIMDNDFTDASVLSSMKVICQVFLNDNPIEKLSLPSKPIEQLRLRNTDITDLGFLDNVLSLGILDVHGTKIKSADELLYLRDISVLDLPAGVDYSKIKLISTLRELTVDGKSVNLK